MIHKVTRDDVVSGYKVILGREPESERAIQSHIDSGSELWPWVESLTRSAEFRRRSGWRPLCFVHIHKTAGSSMLVGLQKALGPGGLYWRGETEPFDAFEHRTGDELTGFAAIGGHISRTEFREKIGDDGVFAAVLRDPVARAISLFDFMKSPFSTSHPIRDEILDLDLEGALRRSQGFVDLVANQQCKLIGSEPTFAAAVAEIASNAWIIGDIAQSEKMFVRMCGKAGVAATQLPRVNIGRDGYADGITEKCRSMLRELNAEDVKLVDWVRSLGD
ncbi:hypothetical protein ACTZWT_19725 [Rhodopseudomonas sp. NSM]|uniref:hypothetical protein n=1 Tax=Rhodopseudomonas sp. NSM TaxID=3457630 RepID=UPI004036CB8E